MQVQGISSIPETRSINNEHNHTIKPPAQIASQGAPSMAKTKGIKLHFGQPPPENNNFDQIYSEDYEDFEDSQEFRAKLRPISQQ